MLVLTTRIQAFQEEMDQPSEMMFEPEKTMEECGLGNF